MKLLHRIPAAIAALLLLAAPAGAQLEGAPSLIDYQGLLLDSVGNPLASSANFEVHFRIWNSQSDTDPAGLVWSEKQIVTVVDGNFSVRLGEGEPFNQNDGQDPLPVTGLVSLANTFDARERYLGITVINPGNPTAEIQPRLRFLTVPFAMVAQTAKAVQSGGIDTGQIQAGNITTALLQDMAVTSQKIEDKGIQAEDVADDTITALQLAPNSVGASELDTGNLNNSIRDTDLATNSVRADEIATGAVGADEIATDAVRASEIQAGAVGTSELASNIGVWSKNGSELGTGGNVGIGTTDPSRGKLDVRGHQVYGSGEQWVGWFYDNSTFPGGVTGQIFWPNIAASYTQNSIYADSNVAANSFIAFSDERIKNVHGISDGSKDLDDLLRIEITDYSFIDQLSRGNRPLKKVVAQQVEQVYPLAVSRSTDVVPDIYQKAETADGWVQLATDLKQGERVRLLSADADGIHEVLEVRDGAFRTGFESSDGRVFVYGREVDDFRNVDYEAISMLNVSATQEMHRRLVAQEEELAAKEVEISSLERRLAAIEERLAGQPAVTPVSLQTTSHN